MSILLTLRDRDIFPKARPSSDISYIFRTAVKIILFDKQGKIALVGSTYRLLPGGGVEGEESLTKAAKRECLEEVGCNIELGKKIAVTEEYRDKIQRHQRTHYYVAYLEGNKGTPSTKQRDELQLEVRWLKLDDAIDLLEAQCKTISVANYNFCFNTRTHFAVLKKLQGEMYFSRARHSVVAY